MAGIGSVENFIIRPLDYRGAYELGDKIERQGERQRQQKQHADAKRASLMNQLMSYADPKDYFTGTPHDPVITQGVNAVLDKGVKYLMDNEGATPELLYTAIAPDVNKLSVASQKLKQIASQRTQGREFVKPNKSVDADKFESEFNKVAFYNPDGELKDLSTVDSNVNYVDETLKSGNVYNNAGFDEFSKTSKVFTEVGKIKNTDKRGGSKMLRTELSAPSHLISEKDDEGNHIGFAPKYEIATENGTPLMHEFQNEDGTKTQAPVRLLDKDVFNDLPAGAKAYLLQETKKFAKQHNIDPASVQAENFARAMAYDELNPRSKKWGTVKVIEETKAPQIKVYNSSSSGKGAGEVDINDIYSKIDKYATTEKDRGLDYGLLNKLDQQSQTVVIDFAKKILGDDTVSNEDLFVKKEADGKLNVYRVPDPGKGVFKTDFTTKNLVGTLPYVGTNIKVQPNTKAKTAVVAEGNSRDKSATSKAQPKKQASLSSIKSLVGKKGYEGYTEKELVDYYKSQGYEIK